MNKAYSELRREALLVSCMNTGWSLLTRLCDPNDLQAKRMLDYILLARQEELVKRFPGSMPAERLYAE